MTRKRIWSSVAWCIPWDKMKIRQKMFLSLSLSFNHDWLLKLREKKEKLDSLSTSWTWLNVWSILNRNFLFFFFASLAKVLIAEIERQGPRESHIHFAVRMKDYRVRTIRRWWWWWRRRSERKKKNRETKTILSSQRWATIDWAETQFIRVRSLSMTSFQSESIRDNTHWSKSTISYKRTCEWIHRNFIVRDEQ